MDATFFTSVDFAVLLAGIVTIGTALVGLTMTESGVKVTRRLIKGA